MTTPAVAAAEPPPSGGVLPSSDGRAPGAGGSLRVAWYALFVLSIVTLFAYLDRTILYLLAQPIKVKLGLSDLQLGLLQGTGVALFAAAASYPLGWLADRYDRRWVMAGCIVFWSLAVVGCGVAQNFEQMLLASALVGAGEAGMVPVIYSMIPDLFPPAKRQLANSIFAIAASSAGGLAFLAGGQMIGAVDGWRPWLPASWQALESWRLAFFIAAVPAPFMLALLTTLRAQMRSDFRPSAETRRVAPPPPPAHSLPLLPFVREHASTVVPFLAGIGIAVLGFGATGAWMVVILMRLYGQTSAEVGALVTPITLVATAAGFAVSVWGSRLAGARLGERLPVRALWLGYIVTAAGNAAVLLTSTATQFFAISATTAIITSASGMLYPTAIQNMVPAHLRGRLVSLQALVFMLCGAAAAPTVGWLSDRLAGEPRGLLYAAVGVSVPALLVAALLLFIAERHYLRTVADARRIDAEATLEPATPP